MDKTRQNTDYGYDIQKLYLEMMLTDAESFVRCQAVFDPSVFDRRLQDSATPGFKDNSASCCKSGPSASRSMAA